MSCHFFFHERQTSPMAYPLRGHQSKSAFHPIRLLRQIYACLDTSLYFIWAGHRERLGPKRDKYMFKFYLKF